MHHDIDFSAHPAEFQQANALVGAWITEHHGYLKDGGGSKGMHYVPRLALITAIAAALKANRTEVVVDESEDIPRALKLLKRAGVGNPPMPGDELPKAAEHPGLPVAASPIPAKRPRKKKADAEAPIE